ncbi:hypothetical protein [Vibrio sp. D431a]|uniref:hypothetical protein n=1 Tax=Vibrio sp. D431a TaxID=2837388 RepID=UPI002556582C|nr:hypothetical protein [Vibrio sp. D431a]MDK9793832.1 hypothetical protein [Vibrio sp. D431a]
MKDLENSINRAIANFEYMSDEEKNLLINELALINEECQIISIAKKVIETSPKLNASISEKNENKSEHKISGIKL